MNKVKKEINLEKNKIHIMDWSNFISINVFTFTLVTYSFNIMQWPLAEKKGER